MAANINNAQASKSIWNMFFNLKTFNSYILLTNTKLLKSGYRLKMIFPYKAVQNIQYYLSTDHIS